MLHGHKFSPIRIDFRKNVGRLVLALRPVDVDLPGSAKICHWTLSPFLQIFTKIDTLQNSR